MLAGRELVVQLLSNSWSLRDNNRLSRRHMVIRWRLGWGKGLSGSALLR